jgi:hypothetical protein
VAVQGGHRRRSAPTAGTADHGVPEGGDLLFTVIQTRRAAYRRVLNRAIARHELDPDVDQEFTIDVLIGPLWTRLLITRQPVTDALVDEVVDVVLRAYPPPAGAADG